jgi:hypothetical protein
MKKFSSYQKVYRSSIFNTLTSPIKYLVWDTKGMRIYGFPHWRWIMWKIGLIKTYLYLVILELMGEDKWNDENNRSFK